MQGPGPVPHVLSPDPPVLAALPGLRVVILGRGDLALLSDDPEDLELGDLDPEAAEAVLERLGVEPAGTARFVVASSAATRSPFAWLPRR